MCRGFFITVALGSQKAIFDVQIDTGSSLFWVQCDCRSIYCEPIGQQTGGGLVGSQPKEGWGDKRSGEGVEIEQAHKHKEREYYSTTATFCVCIYIYIHPSDEKNLSCVCFASQPIHPPFNTSHSSTLQPVPCDSPHCSQFSSSLSATGCDVLSTQLPTIYGPSPPDPTCQYVEKYGESSSSTHPHHHPQSLSSCLYRYCLPHPHLSSPFLSLRPPSSP